MLLNKKVRKSINTYACMEGTNEHYVYQIGVEVVTDVIYIARPLVRK